MKSRTGKGSWVDPAPYCDLPGHRFRFGYRIALLAAVAGLALLMVLSYHVLLPVQTDNALIGIGIGLLALTLVHSLLLGRRGRLLHSPGASRPGLPLRAHRILILIFMLGVAAVVIAAASGRTVSPCPPSASYCTKAIRWTASNGHYAWWAPYDADGADDPNAPWHPVGRADYLLGFGSTLREGVFIPLAIFFFCLIATIGESNVATRLAGAGTTRPTGTGQEPVSTEP